MYFLPILFRTYSTAGLFHSFELKMNLKLTWNVELFLTFDFDFFHIRYGLSRVVIKHFRQAEVLLHPSTFIKINQPLFVSEIYHANAENKKPKQFHNYLLKTIVDYIAIQVVGKEVDLFLKPKL